MKAGKSKLLRKLNLITDAHKTKIYIGGMSDERLSVIDLARLMENIRQIGLIRIHAS